MYSTCLFCHTSLGTNESIENFPIGKRLAFDAANGRLWVVCSKCERWNLTPIEERWEAIDEAERAYRDTKLRVSTDNIGMARLRDRTELIRIGEPLRPEFAAWRYGRSFVDRRKRELLISAGLGAGAIAALSVAAPFVSAATIGGISVGALRLIAKRRLLQPAVRLRSEDGSLVRVTGMMLEMSSLTRRPDGKYSLNVIRRTAHSNGPLAWARGKPMRIETSPYLPTPFVGEHADRALAVLMTAINRFGGTPSSVSRAVKLLEARKNLPGHYLANLLSDHGRMIQSRTHKGAIEFLRLSHLPQDIRLALEMTLHEDDERRAFEGELKALELRWKEAEEIAAISDSLIPPKSALKLPPE